MQKGLHPGVTFGWKIPPQTLPLFIFPVFNIFNWCQLLILLQVKLVFFWKTVLRFYFNNIKRQQPYKYVIDACIQKHFKLKVCGILFLEHRNNSISWLRELEAGLCHCAEWPFVVCWDEIIYNWRSYKWFCSQPPTCVLEESHPSTSVEGTWNCPQPVCPRAEPCISPAIKKG